MPVFDYIDSLEVLSGIVNINGDLKILSATSTTSLIGLESLVNVTGDIIINGIEIESLEPLSNITPSGNVIISGINSESEINIWNDITNPIGNFYLGSVTAPSVSIFNNVSAVENLTLNINSTPLTTLTNTNTAGNITIEASNSTDLTLLNNANTVGNFSANNFNTLTALTNATTINNIYISNVQTVNGVETLQTSGELSIDNINTLSSNVFSQLNQVESLKINGLTPAVLNFTENLENINSSLDVSFTSGLQSLNFNAVNSTNSIKLNISNNQNLQSITGLNSLNTLSECIIEGNGQLTNIDVISSVTNISQFSLKISDNNQLTNLDALSNLSYIECPGQLIVTDNFNLGDLCGLQTLFVNNGLCSFEATIENNGYNPTPLQIANGDCSL